MAKLIPKPKKGESRKDFRKRLIASANSNPFVKYGLVKKIN
jgi:hypothetical protein